MNINLNNHPIWTELDRIFIQLDVKALVAEHLKSCNYKVMGYWDGDEFYEEIAFVNPLRTELESSSIGKTQIDRRGQRWIRLRFLLKADVPALETQSTGDNEEVGELNLVLDLDGKIIDENWLIDVESPFVVARKAPNGSK